MTPSNTLTPAKNAITYTAGGQEITLNAGIIKRYLVSGDADKVTDQEVLLFAKLCQYQGLNPFLREAYLVKYGSSPAQTIVSKGALEKRAARCKDYRGFEAGIIVRRPDGTIEQRPGTFYAEDEQLVGGWAKVYVDGYVVPVEATATLREYSTGKALWASKPATMIRKVAKVCALREAFPDDMQGMYAAEELDDAPEPPAVEIPAAAPPVDSFAAIMEGED